MKKILLSLGLVAVTLVNALADGTINPLPGILGRFRVDTDRDGFPDRNATAADGFQLHLFYGPADVTSPGELIHFPQFALIDGTTGIWTGLPSTLGIPGTEVGQIISLEFRVCTEAGLWGRTGIKRITLGPESGPGTVVWSSTPTANRFGPIVQQLSPTPDVCVPEPSTLAVGALGGLCLLWSARRRLHRG